MDPLTTNISAPTRDVHRFGFESAGAFEIDNEYSGLAVAWPGLLSVRYQDSRSKTVPGINVIKCERGIGTVPAYPPR